MAINEAEELKKQGNTAFSAGDHATANKLFSQALELDPQNHVLYSNRSATYCALRDYKKALEDAEKTVELQPSWAKAYSRKGAALVGLRQFAEAKSAYEKGLEYDPENSALKQGVASVEAELHKSPSMSNLPNPFANPTALAKLASDPRTKDFISQPDFLEKIGELSRNPENLMKHLGDQRILAAYAVALGLPTSTGPPASEPSQSDEPMETTTTETEKEIKEDAVPVNQINPWEQEKEAGNAAYKSRDFASALEHYGKALEFDSNNVTVMNNMAAVYFEQGDLDKCIETCKSALEKGREIKAPYNVVGKTLNRLGTAYLKQEKYEEAINWLQKSLTEHRTADTLTKLKDAEKAMEERKKQEYINPEIGEKERNAGNELFKQGNFAEAVKKYSEAILRDPSDPRAYSNRAACYTKLAAVHEAMKDCETCISIDPSFIKAYIRKAALYMLKREYYKAIEVLETAQSKDLEGKHRTEIHNEMARAQTALYGSQSGASEEETTRNAMKDPEVAAILTDPAMRIILQQMQEDPKAAQDHLSNPDVAAKVKKLVQAGVIKIGRN